MDWTDRTQAISPVGEDGSCRVHPIVRQGPSCPETMPPHPNSYCHTSYKQLSGNKRENKRRSEPCLTRTTCHRASSVFPVCLRESSFVIL
ncbi:hypothetical protein Bca4012_019715 [Brassica carinata]